MVCSKCKSRVSDEDKVICSTCKAEYHVACSGANDTTTLRKTKKIAKCMECAKVDESVKKIQDFENITVEKGFFEAKFKELQDKMEKNKQELIAAYDNKIKTMEKMIETRDEKMLDLEERINLLENKSRNGNIEIKNFPETKGEDVMTIVQRIGAKIGMSCNVGDIQVAHRVNTKSGKQQATRPIIVHLASRYMRNQWLEKLKVYKRSQPQGRGINSKDICASLPESNVMIYEHVTVKTKILLSEVRNFAKEKGIQFVWIKDAFILIKKDQAEKKVIKISTEREFQDYKKKYFPV